MSCCRKPLALFCPCDVFTLLKSPPPRQLSSRTFYTPVSMATHPFRSKPPILVSDVLDTLVVDPFFNGMASHFGFETFNDFINAKTPDVWVNFELGLIDEDQLAQSFFKDERIVNIPLFKTFLKQSYRQIPGTDVLLNALKEANVQVHLCSNYPAWGHLIEEATQLNARYGARWTFISGNEGLRKPDVAAYKRVADKAGVQPSSCILLDDRQPNCDGALQAGYLAAVRFKDAKQASTELATILEAHGIMLKH